MFKPQFAPAVELGLKLQTVRPTPKRMPKPGDPISLRAWTGAPYRSKQRVLRESEVVSVRTIEIDSYAITIDGVRLHHQDEDEFAMADGFLNAVALTDWFHATHGLPFRGIVIAWKPPLKLRPNEKPMDTTNDQIRERAARIPIDRPLSVDEQQLIRLVAGMDIAELNRQMAALMLKTERWRMWIVERGRTHRDHACAECFPDGDSLIKGFRCVYHECRTPNP